MYKKKVIIIMCIGHNIIKPDFIDVYLLFVTEEKTVIELNHRLI